MLTNFIYSQSKGLFLEQLQAGNVPEDAIAFLEDSGEIWNRDHYFGSTGVSNLLTDGKLIGTITANNNPYNIYAPKTYDWSEITGTENVLLKSGGTINGDIQARNFVFGTYNDVAWGKLVIDDSVNNRIYYVDKAGVYNSLLHAGNVGDFTFAATVGRSQSVDSIYNLEYRSVSNGTGLPSSAPYGSLLTLPYRTLNNNEAPDFATQIFLPNGDDSGFPNDMFFRTSDRTSWNAWQRVLTPSNVGKYALKITGGTIKKAEEDNAPLFIDNVGTSWAGIGFKNKNGILGFLGANDGKPVFVDSSFVSHILLHSENVGEYALKIDGSNGMNYGANISWGDVNANLEDYEGYSSGFRVLHYNASTYNYRGGIHVGTRYGFQITRNGSTDNNEWLQCRLNDPDKITWSDWKTIAFTDSTVDKAKKLVTDNNEAYAEFTDGTVYIGGETYSTANAVIMGNAINLRYGGGTNGLILNSSGNVTIGESDLAGSDYKLFVHGGFRVRSTSAGGNLGAKFAGASAFGAENYGLQLWTATTGETLLQTGRFDGNSAVYPICLNPLGGNILIGTTTDRGQKLQVDGVIKTTGGVRFKWGDYFDESGNFVLNQGSSWSIGDGTNDFLRINKATGKVLIGTTIDNGSGAKLQVAGDITINGISLLEKLTNIEQSSDTLEDYVQENRSKSTEAINTANTAKNAVATLEGLANATTAQITLAATVTQIEQNTTDIKVLQNMYVFMTVAEYEALEIKDSDKIYMLYEE